MKLRQGYIDDNGVGHIPLTQGKETLVAAHWYHVLSQHNWYAHFGHRHWYAVRHIRLNGKDTLQSMHRLIMGEPEGMEVDHRNREATLDNRESNLRIATHSQSQHNHGVSANSTSGVKGVHWVKRYKKWGARIMVNGKSFYLGYFATRLEAAQAYNDAALLYHKEFAALNVLSPAQAAIAA